MIATIPAELERFVASTVSSGRFVSVDEAVAAGLRLLQQQREQFGDIERPEREESMQTLRSAMAQDDCGLDELVEVRSDGAFAIRGHRVSVYLILKAFREGLTVEAIHDRYPTIAPSTIRRLTMFAVSQPEIVEQWFMTEQAAADAACSESTRGSSLDELRSRLPTRTAG